MSETSEVLRRAAGMMRERAERARTYSDAATGLPLGWVSTAGHQVYGLGGDLICETEVGAAHIASWHPAVALAVADWLDHTVALFRGNDAALSIHPALSVARAYLGADQ